MAQCAEIRQSIEVAAPPDVANEQWTQFIFYTLYARSSGPDAGDAEPEGMVRVEGVGPNRSRVTVDLNYCPQYEDIDDQKEIVDVREHLAWTLGRYKEFVERRAAA
jgi:hypothetical protein